MWLSQGFFPNPHSYFSQCSMNANSKFSHIKHFIESKVIFIKLIRGILVDKCIHFMHNFIINYMIFISKGPDQKSLFIIITTITTDFWQSWETSGKRRGTGIVAATVIRPWSWFIVFVRQVRLVRRVASTFIGWVWLVRGAAVGFASPTSSSIRRRIVPARGICLAVGEDFFGEILDSPLILKAA